MAHRPCRSITHLPRSSPGWPQDPYQGLWPDRRPKFAAFELPQSLDLIALFQAHRLGGLLTPRWLG